MLSNTPPQLCQVHLPRQHANTATPQLHHGELRRATTRLCLTLGAPRHEFSQNNFHPILTSARSFDLRDVSVSFGAQI